MAKKRKSSSKKSEAAHLVEVLRKKAQAYLRLPGVTSVGVGEEIKDGKPTGRLAIQFTVERKLKTSVLEAAGLTALPESIIDDDGTEIPVDVIQRSYHASYTLVDPKKRRAQRATEVVQRRSRMDPIVSGISIAHRLESAGTVGAIVFDNLTSQPLILSNWHVLNGPAGNIGDEIAQPGPFDDGNVDQNIMGNLFRSHLGLAGDCAVCTIKGREFAPSVLELNVTPKRAATVDLNDKVVKSGRTTGVTFGVVRRIGVVANINYGGSVGIQQIGGFEIGPNPDKTPDNGEISMGGDSGSVWLIDGAANDIVVGLHFAGETDPNPTEEHAVACNIHSVLEKLNISLEAG